jgi:hypothetical protein
MNSLADFPDPLQDAIANTYERLISGRMRTPRVREVVERIKKPTTTANRRSNLAIPRRPTTAARATPIVTPVKRWQGSTSQICNFGLQRSGAEHCAVIASVIETCKLNDVDPLA